MTKIKQTIEAHNSDYQSSKITPADCYCRQNNQCPHTGKRPTNRKNYQAIVSTNKNTPEKMNIGLIEGPSKGRHSDHMQARSIAWKVENT